MSFHPSRPCARMLLALLVAACGGGGASGEPTLPPPPAAPLSLSVTSVSLVPGEKSAITASGGGSAALQWRSDNPSVATVSASGEVAAVAPGSTEVVVTRGSESARAAVTVAQGGMVGSSGGEVATTDSTVVVQVPTGAVPGSTKVEMKPVPDPTGSAISAVMQVGPPGSEGASLAAPATIEIAVDDAKIPDWVEPASLRLARLVNGRWEVIDTKTEQVAHATVADAGAGGAPANVSAGRQLLHRWRYRAPISYWGSYTVVDPCSPAPVEALTLAGSIGTLDCTFPLPGGGTRFSDYVRFTIPNGQVQRVSVTAAFVAILGIKENTADPKTGLVHASMRSNDPVTQHFRIVGNGAPVQMFVSGLDATSLGAYTVTRSIVTEAHSCTDYDFVLPGAAFTTTLNEANSCAGKIAFTNDETVKGKPILYQDYTLKVKKGVPVTVRMVGSSSFNPVLTIFGYNPATQSLYVMAQDLGTATTRTLTVTPTYDGYIYPEVASGRSDGNGGWIIPTGSYSMSVSAF